MSKEKQEILVSVIVPAYNAENSIKKCLDSLLNQTLKNIEIIVINDCSQDDTLKILKTYKDKIVLIDNKKNLGPSASRNKALDIAKGKYIGFVDSDDYVDKTMYEKMSSCMNDEVDLVCCGRYNITKGKKEEIINRSKETDPHKFSKTSNYNTDKLFKREIIEKNKLRQPEDFMYAEDFAFGIRYKYYARKMYIIEEPLYYYVFDSDNSITNSYNENIIKIITVLEQMLDFFKEKKAFAKYEEELVNICAGFYVRRTREFKNFRNIELKKRFVKKFLVFFKNNFKHYVHQVNGFKTKYYRFYRCSYPMMLVYILISEMRSK